MNAATPPPMLVVLAGDDDVGRLVVSLESFLGFADEVTQALEMLEDDWYQLSVLQRRRRKITKSKTGATNAVRTKATGRRRHPR